MLRWNGWESLRLTCKGNWMHMKKKTPRAGVFHAAGAALSKSSAICFWFGESELSSC
ncbi:hypothetical protein STW0522KLE44_10980 [Klebsiella sp. STW0522-44]|nr:hypothetical protein STW0522KLE44_10980 [Klebsiella sp. STW0522-44]